MDNNTFVLATNKAWHIAVFNQRVQYYPGRWLLLENPRDLNLPFVHTYQPRYIFFPHWSERVPTCILEATQCVCFHESDVPFGRGGSPIQNLIVRGHKNTVISALQMVDELDAGPVYCKEALALNGSAQEIFERSAIIIAEMIRKIVSENPIPQPQKGKAVVFKRRQPEQSRLHNHYQHLEQVYDHIRMLDADGYPRAFIELGNLRLQFCDATKTQNGLQARVVISEINPEKTAIHD